MVPSSASCAQIVSLAFSTALPIVCMFGPMALCYMASEECSLGRVEIVGAMLVVLMHRAIVAVKYAYLNDLELQSLVSQTLSQKHLPLHSALKFYAWPVKVDAYP